MALAAAVVVVVVVVAIAILYERTAPLRAAILEVDGTSITMGYFLKRASYAAAEPSVVLQTLVNEQIIEQAAPLRPYAIKVTDADVDQLLMEKVRGERGTVDESGFKSWYREELAKTPFTETEFRDLARRNLLRQRLTASLQQRVPTVAAQVHLSMITQSTGEDALEAMRRLDAGEDFVTLAHELNLDEQLKRRGGDMGWYPRAALPENVATAAFDELDPGKHSEPLVVDQQYVAIIMVQEKAVARKIDEQTFQVLTANALKLWLQQELPKHKVVVHGLHKDYDQETDAWIQWQLQHMRKQHRGMT